MSSTVHSKTRAIDSAVSHYRHPVLFYALATAVPWALWLTAGALSRQAATPASEIAVATLGLAWPPRWWPATRGCAATPCIGS